MSNHSVIEHRANYHFAKLEEDYLAVCSTGKTSPHCKALILSILECWTNSKRDKGEGEYVFMTVPQWIKYTYMLYERNMITACMRELMEEGLIERRAIVMYNQKTFEYKLCVEQVQARIKALPEKTAKDTLPNLIAYITYQEKCKEKNRAAREEKKVRDLSPTHSDSDKSQGVRDNSPTVGDKSTGGYVINQRNLESITKLPLTSNQRESDAPTDTQPAPLSDIALAHPTPLPLSVFADENLHVDMPPLSTQRVVLSAREGVAEPVAMLNDEADRAVIAHMLSQQGNPNSVFYLPPAPTQPVLAPVADIAAPQEDNAVTVTTEPLPRNPIAAAAASSLTPDVDIQTETPAGKKPPKGKGAKVTPDQKARMGKVMNYIDSLLQEVTGDPDEGYSRTTKIGQDALYTLLFGRKHSERRVTQERVRKVFLAMWNEPRNTRTGYYLRENMGYNKICEEYEKRIHSLIAEENGKGKGAATSNGIIDLVEWQGRKMSQAEAKKLGYTGFEKYIGNGPDDLAELDRITANSPEIQALIREALEA